MVVKSSSFMMVFIPHHEQISFRLQTHFMLEILPSLQTHFILDKASCGLKAGIGGELGAEAPKMTEQGPP
jgi:hypothetical protein